MHKSQWKTGNLPCPLVFRTVVHQNEPTSSELALGETFMEETYFADEILKYSNSRNLTVLSVEDPMDLPPSSERIGLVWMPTTLGTPSTFAVLQLGEVRLLATGLPPSLFEGRIEAGRAAVWWSMDEPHVTIANGTRCPANAFYFGGPGARCQAYWPASAGTRQTAVALSLPWDRVSSVWPVTDTLFDTCHVDVPGLERLRRLTRETLRWASDEADEPWDSPRSIAVGRELVDRVTDLFATARPVADPQAALKRRWLDTLDRIDHLIETRLDRPILLDEIAAELRLSPRSVHNIMKTMRGMTLQTHVKIVRLRSIRRHLVRNETRELIKQVALAHGYAHLGRLARDYTQFFGESPSTTLARKRR